MRYDGKHVATLIENNIKPFINNHHLAIIIVGNRSDSELYVSLKIKKCQELGINHTLIKLPNDINEEKFIYHIQKLNKDNNINGILVQLPIPEHLNKQKILDTIDYKKDIDCLTSFNLGKFFIGNPIYYPCTPKAIMNILEFYNIDVFSKTVCVVGSGNVGRSISFLLLQKNATVITTNKYTTNLKHYTLQADIIISCCGQPLMIKDDWVRENCHIIDVGISKIKNKTVGDVDYDNVSKKANVNKLTVGPVTIMVLLEQLVKTKKIDFSDKIS